MSQFFNDHEIQNPGIWLINLNLLNFSNWVFAILVKLCSAQDTNAHYV